MQVFGHYSIDRDPSPENQAFWAEREADQLIGGFGGRYLRLQAEWDHAQPPRFAEEIASFHQPPVWWQNKHTADMVNAALAGNASWVRVNLPDQANPVSETYDATHQPVYLPGRLGAGTSWGATAVIEMARME